MPTNGVDQMPHQTHAETSALAAVMDDDRAEARRILSDFTGRQLSELVDHLDALSELIAAEQGRRLGA